MTALLLSFVDVVEDVASLAVNPLLARECVERLHGINRPLTAVEAVVLDQALRACRAATNPAAVRDTRLLLAGVLVGFQDTA